MYIYPYVLLAPGASTKLTALNFGDKLFTRRIISTRDTGGNLYDKKQKIKLIEQILPGHVQCRR